MHHSTFCISTLNKPICINSSQVRIFALHEILAYMEGHVSTRWRPSSAIVHQDTLGTIVQVRPNQ